MRVALAFLLCTVWIVVASAEGFLRREPPMLSPGATVYVDNGQCEPGKVLKVTAAFKGSSRKKTCVTVDPRDDD
jgi:hypothetical protein